MTNINLICPDCGNRSKVHQELRGGESIWLIYCPNCGRDTGEHDTLRSAIRCWMDVADNGPKLDSDAKSHADIGNVSSRRH